MSSWGVRMELLQIAMHATCHQEEGSLQCPPFNLPILPGQNGRVKNDCFLNLGYFLRSLGYVVRGGEKEEEHL